MAISRQKVREKMSEQTVWNPFAKVDRVLNEAGFVIVRRRAVERVLGMKFLIWVGKRDENGEFVKDVWNYKDELDKLLNPLGFSEPWYQPLQTAYKQYHGVRMKVCENQTFLMKSQWDGLKKSSIDRLVRVPTVALHPSTRFFDPLLTRTRRSFDIF